MGKVVNIGTDLSLHSAKNEMITVRDAQRAYREKSTRVRNEILERQIEAAKKSCAALKAFGALSPQYAEAQEEAQKVVAEGRAINDALREEFRELMAHHDDVKARRGL